MYIVKPADIFNETDPAELIWKCLAWRDPVVGTLFQVTCFGRSATRNTLVSKQKIEETIERFIELGFC